MNITLNGLRVLNTRPINQASALSEAIKALGGYPIELPTITIIPTAVDWIKTLPSLSSLDSALFISANAVYYTFEALNNASISWPKQIPVYAIGANTAKMLLAQKIKTVLFPEIADSEHFLTMPALQKITHKKIALFKGCGGRSLIIDTLIQRGAILSIYDVYQRTMPNINQAYLKSLWQDDRIDIILVTSEQSLLNIISLFGPDAFDWLCHKPFLVISDRLAEKTRAQGIRRIMKCPPEEMISALMGFSKRTLS